jgi:hypothetical protein
MPSPHPPFVEADRARIIDALAKITEAEAHVKRAQLAALDVGDAVTRLESSKHKLLAIKQVYFDSA